jgi:8-oxo-dGTP pyrophosphatase MutT (NUDIX family)
MSDQTTIWKPHATVAAIIERDGKFLMVEEDVEGEIVYNQPAGHLDPGESLIDAVIRETQEETAWGFMPEAVTGIYLWDQPDTTRTFLRVTFTGKCHHQREDQPLDEGILRALWMSRDELLAKQSQLRSPLVMECIDDYLAGKRYPLEMLAVIGSRH